MGSQLGFITRSRDYLQLKSLHWTRTSASMTQLILYGSFIVAVILVVLLAVSLFALHDAYVVVRIIAGLVIILYLCVVAHILKLKHTRIGAWMLIILYWMIAGFILHAWGVNAPIGILLLGFVIILTNILLGSRYIGFITAAAILLLVFLQLSSEIGLAHPDRSVLDDTSTFSDIANYSVIFSIFALIAWMSGRRTEDSLRRALAAELQLQEERDSLARTLEERTRSLHESQAKEMKQLYRFAELGQLTTVILHELANYLSVLTLDIDDLKERHQNSLAIDRAKESISYIDTIIEQVRDQIKQSDTIEKFNPSPVIKNTITQLKKKLPAIHITFTDTRNAVHKKKTIVGDPLRLSQVITILVTNAAQANVTQRRARIFIEIHATATTLTISVKDFGPGISAQKRQKLFEPHNSVKQHGLGIGLYITKQIIETHYKGSVGLDPSLAFTKFNLKIPTSR